jgi:hypothetical protein
VADPCCGDHHREAMNGFPATATVLVGSYSLEIGAAARTFAEFEPQGEEDRARELSTERTAG